MEPSWLPLVELSSSPQKKKVKSDRTTEIPEHFGVCSLQGDSSCGLELSRCRKGVCVVTLSPRSVFSKLFRLCKLSCVTLSQITQRCFAVNSYRGAETEPSRAEPRRAFAPCRDMLASAAAACPRRLSAVRTLLWLNCTMESRLSDRSASRRTGVCLLKPRRCFCGALTHRADT